MSSNHIFDYSSNVSESISLPVVEASHHILFELLIFNPVNLSQSPGELSSLILVQLSQLQSPLEFVSFSGNFGFTSGESSLLLWVKSIIMFVLESVSIIVQFSPERSVHLIVVLVRSSPSFHQGRATLQGDLW